MSFKTFAAEAIADYKATGAVAPSSRSLAKAMLQPLSLRPGCVIAEWGPGTGVMTQGLLEILPPDGKLLAFEISARFCDYLKNKLRDQRLEILNTGAENLVEELRRRGCNRADAVVSSLALGFFSDTDRRRLMKVLAVAMDENSVYTQYQYVQGLEMRNGHFRRFSVRPLLGEYFGSVQCKTVWRNIPPAFVYACHKRKGISIRGFSDCP